MKKNKILVIGGKGQLGSDIMDEFSKDYEVISLDHSDVDVCDYQLLEQKIKEYSPDCIINTSAFHKVDECEEKIEKSFQVNALGVANLAKIAKQLNAVFFTISTDYVFDGNKDFYTEDDMPHPLNVYGISKLAGEQLAEIIYEKIYIIRTSALFGKTLSGKGYNFVTLMIKKAKEEGELKVVSDQFTCPTYTSDLALKIKEIYKAKLAFGIYHLTNQGSCSWFEFASEIIKQSGIKASITKTTSGDYKSPANRPKNGVMKSIKINNDNIGSMPTWQDALGRYLKIL